MQSVSDSQLDLIKDLYYRDKMSVPMIAARLGVSIDAAYYFFRKYDLERRGCSEEQKARFERKTPSFTKRKIDTPELKELAAMGIMLYWAEGYKGSETSSYSSVDFANSDVKMIALFLNFLRKVYVINEEKLRVFLYCYADQDIPSLIKFWSKNTGIPTSQFTKPFIRQDFNTLGRKMPHGMVHIRYSDKKLLLEIKKLIECYSSKYAPIG
jgi:hypothetical protein